MTRHLWMCLFAVLGACSAANAQSLSDKATIVYDVKLREFVCWCEGELTPALRNAPCATDGWHPVTSDLYFVRGQSVTLFLRNATALNIFSIDVSAEELPEPKTDVSGTVSALPQLVPLIPAPTVVAGLGSTIERSAVPVSVDPVQVYRMLTAAEEKDFLPGVRTLLVTSLGTKDVLDLLAVDISTALADLKATTPGYITEAATLQKDITAIGNPTSTLDLISFSRVLAAIIDQEVALQGRLNASGVPAAGKTVADARRTLLTLPLQAALALDRGKFRAFVSEFETAFPVEARYARIAAILNDNGVLGVDPKYKDTGSPAVEMAQFLKQTQTAAGGKVTPEGFARLKKNLVALADNWSEVSTAEKRLDRLASVADAIETHTQSPTGVFALQRQLNSLSNATIEKASTLNRRAGELPLDAGLEELPIGQWFGSRLVKVTVKQGQRAPIFDLAAVAASSAGSAVGPGTAQPKASQTAVGDLGTVRAFQFRVYNLYRVQVGVGAAFSSADDTKFQITSVTAGGTTQKFADQTVSRSYNALWTANLMIFPAARHAFPWRARYTGESPPHGLSNLGAMIGFSIPDPMRNIFLGGAWFPQRNAVGIQFSWHLAYRDVPEGDPNAALTERVTVLERKRFNGFSVGIVATPDFFTKALAPIFKP